MQRVFIGPNSFPTKGGDDGDALLWASLLHVSGEDHLKGILSCQSDSGKFWRSPFRVGENDINSFSRDMACGLILAATYDFKVNGQDGLLHKALQKWVDFVIANGSKACESTDNRGVMSFPVLWLAAHAGCKLPWYIEKTKNLIWPYLLLTSKINKTGYTLHLVGVQLLTMMQLHDNYFTKKAGSILYERQQSNPFFAYLAGSYKTATALVQPFYINTLYNQQGSMKQWAWERDDEEKAWKDSCGHDFTFINNMLKNVDKAVK